MRKHTNKHRVVHDNGICRMVKTVQVGDLNARATSAYPVSNLDESMARRQLKSPQSLSGGSIPLTLVTKWSWSWMTYCHPLCAIVTDHAGIEPRVACSTVQRLNHWVIKVPERPSHLRLAGSLHYSPLFKIRAPWLGPLSTKAGSIHSKVNLGYRCHQCNRPWGDRTPAPRSLAPQSNA